MILSGVFLFVSLLSAGFFLWRRPEKKLRTIVLCFSFVSIIGLAVTVIPQELGSIPNLLLLLWTTFHFWLFGKFDQ